MMSLLHFWTFNVSVALLSMQGQKALRFNQKYLNLCSDEERRSYRLETTCGWAINETNHFGVNYTFNSKFWDINFEINTKKLPFFNILWQKWTSRHDQMKIGPKNDSNTLLWTGNCCFIMSIIINSICFNCIPVLHISVLEKKKETTCWQKCTCNASPTDPQTSIVNALRSTHFFVFLQKNCPTTSPEFYIAATHQPRAINLCASFIKAFINGTWKPHDLFANKCCAS